MKEYFISLQNEIGFYYNLIKYFLYFCIGALFLFLLNYCLKIFNFLFSKFSKEKLISHLNLTLRFLIFAVVSILLGKIILYLIFNQMTKLSDYAILLIGFPFLFLLLNKIAFGVSLILGILILIFFNLEAIINKSKRIFKKISKYEVLITSFFLFFFLFLLFYQSNHTDHFW